MCDSKKKYKLQDISSGYIVCVKCNERKPLDEYYFNKGYYNYCCKECNSKKYKESRGLPLRNNKPIIKENGKKVCVTCGEEKELHEYSKIKEKYYSYSCSKCLYSKYSKYPKREKKIKEPEVLSEEQELFQNGFKKCKTCEKVLPFEKFPNKNYSRLSKRGCDCTSCKCSKKIKNPKYIEYQKKWGQSEKGKESIRRSGKKQDEKLKEQKRIVREEKNKEKEILRLERLEKRKIRESEWGLKRQERNKKKLEWEKQQEYYKTDEWKKIKKERDAKKRYDRWKRRWNEDETFALTVRLLNLIRNSFRRGGYTKFEKRTESIVGMDYASFKEYLESNFVDGMSWVHRGEWHIDHIIPLSSANTEEELISLCHYSNLQPLWGEDNIRKSNKIL